MDVIRALKTCLRYEMRTRIIDIIEDESETNINASVVAKKFSIVDALRMLSNCWRKANFLSVSEEQDLELEEIISIPNGISEEMFKKWVALKKMTVCVPNLH